MIITLNLLVCWIEKIRKEKILLICIHTIQLFTHSLTHSFIHTHTHIHIYCMYWFLIKKHNKLEIQKKEEYNGKFVKIFIYINTKWYIYMLISMLSIRLIGRRRKYIIDFNSVDYINFASTPFMHVFFFSFYISFS
jgi:hypothetical protein